ncbi:MAG TPA: tetratricopeptide repeat protein [Aggregatilineaceae bacterium]|nr:tetratricopeptide repeat protein [Aggregatilineaceae bacterium]
MKLKLILLLLISALFVVLFAVPGVIQAQTDITCADLAPEGVPAAYFVGLGDAYLAQGDYALTTVAYTCALDLDAAYAPAYIHRGLAYATQGADAQAMDDYNRALELDETLIAAYNNRGMLYLRQGNFGLALTDFDLAVALDPAYAIGYHNRGLVHAAEGNYDLAIADFQQALTLDPTYAAPHASLGAVYSALALRSYETYSSLSGSRPFPPAGKPVDIFSALEDGLATGNISIWLAFLTPAS